MKLTKANLRKILTEERKSIRLHHCSRLDLDRFNKNLSKLPKLGYGAYSTVRSYKNRFALKSYNLSGNMAWVSYALLCRGLQKANGANPLMPEIGSTAVSTCHRMKSLDDYDSLDSDNHVAVTVMEKLSTLSGFGVPDIYDQGFHILSSFKVPRSRGIDWADFHVEVKINKNLSEILAVIDFLRSEYDFKDDFHSGNIMLRGRQPVITDPLCGGYSW